METRANAQRFASQISLYRQSLAPCGATGFDAKNQAHSALIYCRHKEVEKIS